jgi:hypothetical protein
MAVVPRNSKAADNQPIAKATSINAANSATGSRRTPIKAHFTKDIGR